MSRKARREFRLLDEGPKRDAAELPEDLREGLDAVPSIELRANPNVHRARFHHGMHRMVYLVAEGQKKIIVKRIRPRAIAYGLEFREAADAVSAPAKFADHFAAAAGFDDGGLTPLIDAGVESRSDRLQCSDRDSAICWSTPDSTVRRAIHAHPGFPEGAGEDVSADECEEGARGEWKRGYFEMDWPETLRVGQPKQQDEASPGAGDDEP